MKKLSDTYLVAGLMTKGFAPIDRIFENNKVYFVFEDQDDFAIDQAIEDYKLNKMEVPAQEYADMVRNIKGIVWETINANK